MKELGSRIVDLLEFPPYSFPPEERRALFLDLVKDELEYACERHPAFRNYVRYWPVDPCKARTAADLPYLPVALLKSDPPLALVDRSEIKRILTSSSTTGQSPSRIALDSATARRMTKGVVVIAQDFLGAARRPFLVVDTPSSVGGGDELGARGAAIRGLQPFASEVVYCLEADAEQRLVLDEDKIVEFAEAMGDRAVLVYGFTYILWNHLVKELRAKDIKLAMPNVHILHSGGWKRLQEDAVDKKAFNEGLAQVFGCSSNRVIDFYGMVENVGVIYPDCPEGNKHVPIFGDVIVRDPLTLNPVSEGGRGIVQVCSVLPTSFPGQMLLTEDMAEIVAYDGCPCGRRGTAFRFLGRVPKAEVRGCGNIERRHG
jgi:hypothetical protein